MTLTITSRAFNQDAASRQAGRQPGAGVHHRPGAAGPYVAVDLLAMSGVEDLDLPLPHHRELARAADLA